MAPYCQPGLSLHYLRRADDHGVPRMHENVVAGGETPRDHAVAAALADFKLLQQPEVARH